MSKEKAKLLVEGVELLINTRLLQWDVLNESAEDYWKRRQGKMNEIKNNLIDLLTQE